MIEIFLALFAFLFIAIGTHSLFRYRRDWLCIWRGKKVQVRKTLRSVSLIIEGQEIQLNKVSNSYEGFFEDSQNSSIPVHLSFHVDSNGIVGSCQVVLDGEIVPVIEAPRNMWGESNPEALPTLKERVIIEGTSISDPRFVAAERLYESICTEAKEDTETIALLQELHQKLVEHIIIAERLLQSKSDYIALGNDGGDLEILEQETQERIQLMLRSLQDLHLAIVQRNLSSDQNTLQQVREVLWKLQADTEVEENTSKKNKIRVQQRNKT